MNMQCSTVQQASYEEIAITHWYTAQHRYHINYVLIEAIYVTAVIPAKDTNFSTKYMHYTTCSFNAIEACIT